MNSCNRGGGEKGEDEVHTISQFHSLLQNNLFLLYVTSLNYTDQWSEIGGQRKWNKFASEKGREESADNFIRIIGHGEKMKKKRL